MDLRNRIKRPGSTLVLLTRATHPGAIDGFAWTRRENEGDLNAWHNILGGDRMSGWRASSLTLHGPGHNVTT